jgi:hypothetical protein
MYRDADCSRVQVKIETATHAIEQSGSAHRRRNNFCMGRFIPTSSFLLLFCRREKDLIRVGLLG